MDNQTSQYAIETFSLTKVFPDWWGRAKVIAVENLNLKVKSNEVYGLLGPNGSGKTTTLKMLLSLLHPSKGKFLVLGGSTRDTKICQRIGYLPEESYLYKYLSARETLEFYGRIFGLPSSVRKSRIDNLLEMVGLAGMANRAVGTFSKGMARRIGLAQALINDPEVLILDEPTSGMDPLGTRQMKDLIVELGRRGKTVLLCSHLLADVEDVCDRIGIMYGGRMQVEGPVRSLLKKTNTKQITTGIISDSAIDKIKSVLESEHQPFEIAEPMDKLEEFFIRTVDAAQQRQHPTSGAISKTKADTYFMEEKRKSDLLEQLVEKVPSLTQQRDDAVVQTEKPQPVESSDQPDSNILEQLTSQYESDDLQITQTQSPGSKRIEDDRKVKEDVLNDLLGNRGENSATELTHPENDGEDKNA